MTTDDVRLAAADLLDTMLDVLAERGLSCRGQVDAENRVCVVHACGIAADRLGDGRLSRPWRIALNSVQHEAGGDDIELGNWSDSSSYEDVTLCLKRAAASLREAAS